MYIDWALREMTFSHGEIGDESQCMEIAFEQGIVPAMRDSARIDIGRIEIPPFKNRDDTATVIVFPGLSANGVDLSGEIKR